MGKLKTQPTSQVQQERQPETSPATPISQSITAEVTNDTRLSNSDSDDLQFFLEQTLKDLDYINLKEKRITGELDPGTTSAISLKENLPVPKKAYTHDRLLGILGRCQLQGHIAHFYNLQFEIERHIKTTAELENSRFLEAYEYLKSNPSTEAVFIFEKKMVATNRVNGRLIQTNITS